MASVILFLFSFILTIIFPPISIPVNVLGVIFAKGRIQKAYGLLLALSLAFCAYSFVPRSGYDLIYHQGVVDRFVDINTYDEFASIFSKINLEPIPKIFSFVVAKIGDYDVLQATIVFIGYSLLFYMLIDYKNRVSLSNKKFVSALMLVTFGQHMLYYFSGLYNYFAINLFTFGIYLDYICNRKKACWAIYVLAPFVHISMFFPLGLIVLFKLMREKISKKKALLLLLFFALLAFASDYVINNLNITYLIQAKNTFVHYVAENSIMSQFYDGFYLFMSISKIIIVLLACYMMRDEDEEKRKLRNFVVTFTIATIVLSFSSLAITRFTSLALFAAIPLIFDSLKRDTVSSHHFSALVFLCGALYALYTIRLMVPMIQFGGIA